MRNVIHLRDARRARGRYHPFGNNAQVIQLPVICAADIISYDNNQGARDDQHVTEDPRRVSCADCRQRIRG